MASQFGRKLFCTKNMSSLKTVKKCVKWVLSSQEKCSMLKTDFCQNSLKNTKRFFNS